MFARALPTLSHHAFFSFWLIILKWPDDLESFKWVNVTVRLPTTGPGRYANYFKITCGPAQIRIGCKLARADVVQTCGFGKKTNRSELTTMTDCLYLVFAVPDFSQSSPYLPCGQAEFLDA